jgi:hypothetical protein
MPEACAGVEDLRRAVAAMEERVCGLCVEADEKGYPEKLVTLVGVFGRAAGLDRDVYRQGRVRVSSDLLGLLVTVDVKAGWFRWQRVYSAFCGKTRRYVPGPWEAELLEACARAEAELLRRRVEELDGLLAGCCFGQTTGEGTDGGW